MDRTKVVRWIIGILSIGLVVAGILFYKSILSYVIISFIIAYLIAPIINYAQKFHIPRALSILIVYIIIIGLIVILLNVIIPQVKVQAEEASKFFKDIVKDPNAFSLKSLGLDGLSNFLDRIQTRFTFINIDEYTQTLGQQFVTMLNQIPQLIISSVSQIINILAFIIVIPFITFFMLKDERRLFKTFFSWIPNRYFEFSIYLFEKIEDSFGRYLRSILLETIIVALMSYIGLLILGIPYALTLSIIIGLTNPIKFFGPFIGFVPVILVILFSPVPNVMLIYAILMSLVVQQVDSNILFPSLVGKGLGMHPLWVLLTVIAGGYAFGILGLLFAVPVVFLIKTAVQVSATSLKQFEII
ncbi:MAG TPA: AI-2E family transporter [Candidatus Cloacimonetes bacterium]|nr:AI-2E family transporter [Candidatus Cloacimonadota bacterium]HEX37974.1 AI-2E family transporter [Candidatus Cloacimonadota bacterium]